MKGRRITYSEAELVFIEALHQLPRRDLHAAFVKWSGRSDVSQANLTALCKRKGWLTGRTGQFVPGQVPPNKGRKMPFNPNSAKTQFKKGARPHTFRGAGHERIDAKDGYVIMIVDEPNPWTGAATRPVQKHRWLWEKVNGPVPEGMCLKCLDGDKTNTDPSNWEAIPRAMLPRLNGRFGRGYDVASAELKPTILATAKLEHAVRNRRRDEE
ncbi:HNH endonuclease [Sulfitobacter alexandrii]|uniref:HNH endonuclease n=1 Tax=Sulfitobacter alexandrii TaxID=1917485 RepID=A0A1J0WH43_9RHOB|nr:HNH endonuclease signature motif containing protein [Sulfitobacter alexandrii]APE43633.1 HNH endonuclease [Sulfitobacter alexandrii]